MKNGWHCECNGESYCFRNYLISRENILEVREFVLYSRPDLKLPILYYQGWVQCSGRGQIQFLVYTDTKEMDPESTSTSDFYFSPIEIKDEDGNILHRIAQTQRKYLNEQYLDLTQVPELADPITITFPTNKKIYVDMEVWDYDDSNPPDFVRSMTNMNVPFHLKQASPYWNVKTYRSSPNAEASLKFKYKILECDEGFDGYGCNSCANNYYPAGQCTKFCEPEANKYTCASEGVKECLENYYPAGQCTKFCEPEANKYTCTSEGDKECLENYYPAGQCTKFCEPETNKYTCTSEGVKECLENYYPAGQCTKFCEPEANKYTCTFEGGKECIGNRQGAECDVCTVNFYGEDCSHLCEESDSYVCNKDGSKACKQDYYPDGECTVFCTETSNFTCSEEGIKVCAERRKGHDCQICDSHYFGENCSAFCRPNEKYICSEIGEKICIDDTADPDIDCLKNNNILIIGIVAGIVILVFLVGSAILVCVKRGRGRNLEKGEVNTNVALTTMKSKDKVPQTGDPEDSEGIYSDLGGSADDENQSGISVEEKNVYIDADEDVRLERIHGKTSIGKATKK